MPCHEAVRCCDARYRHRCEASESSHRGARPCRIIVTTHGSGLGTLRPRPSPRRRRHRRATTATELHRAPAPSAPIEPSPPIADEGDALNPKRPHPDDRPCRCDALTATWSPLRRCDRNGPMTAPRALQRPTKLSPMKFIRRKTHFDRPARPAQLCRRELDADTAAPRAVPGIGASGPRAMNVLPCRTAATCRTTRDRWRKFWRRFLDP